MRVTGDFDLRLETTGDAGECPADTLISVTSDALNEVLSNDDIDEDSACSMLEVPAVNAVYAVEVRGGETAPADETVDYVLVVDILELCTPGEGECPDPCVVENGGCHPQAECRLTARSVTCACASGPMETGTTRQDIDECNDGSSTVPRPPNVRTPKVPTNANVSRLPGDGRTCDAVLCRRMSALTPINVCLVHQAHRMMRAMLRRGRIRAAMPSSATPISACLAMPVWDANQGQAMQQVTMRRI